MIKFHLKPFSLSLSSADLLILYFALTSFFLSVGPINTSEGWENCLIWLTKNVEIVLLNYIYASYFNFDATQKCKENLAFFAPFL